MVHLGQLLRLQQVDSDHPLEKAQPKAHHCSLGCTSPQGPQYHSQSHQTPPHASHPLHGLDGETEARDSSLLARATQHTRAGPRALSTVSQGPAHTAGLSNLPSEQLIQLQPFPPVPTTMANPVT